MTGELSSEDFATIRSWREEAGVLLDIDGHKIPEHGSIIVTCSDGHRIRDVLGYHAQAIVKNGRCGGDDPCTHTLCLNGGALLIARRKESLVRHGEDRVLLAHIGAAMPIKQLRTIALYVHLPCGVVAKHGLTVVQAMELLKLAKKRVEQKFPQATVSCFLHVALAEKQRTYFVCGPAWRAWRAEHRGLAVLS